VESVNRALAQLQGVTQENAGMVQSASHSATTLGEEAARLSDLVGRFRLDEVDSAPPRAVPAIPAKGKQIKRLRG
jgi:methyl-accepting chemotaxis protein